VLGFIPRDYWLQWNDAWIASSLIPFSETEFSEKEITGNANIISPQFPNLERSVIITGPPNGPVLFCTLSSVIVCNARGRSAAAGPGAWLVRRPTLHGGTVRLRPVRATPCLGMLVPWTEVEYVSMHILTVTNFLYFIYASCSGRLDVGQRDVNSLQHLQSDRRDDASTKLFLNLSIQFYYWPA